MNGSHDRDIAKMKQWAESHEKQCIERAAEAKEDRKDKARRLRRLEIAVAILLLMGASAHPILKPVLAFIGG